MPLFEGCDLACMRGGRMVFAGLRFALPPGGALILTGPNGSGKSSLLRVMAGLLRPAGGRLLWDGKAIGQDADAHRARLAFLGHLDAIKPVLSAKENLAFWANLHGAGPDRVEAALAHFGLAGQASLPARLLSAGQRRRLALARLHAVAAELWLLDEPTVALDRPSVGALEAALAAHRAGGGRVAVATHQALDLPDAEMLSLGKFPAAESLLEYVW